MKTLLLSSIFLSVSIYLFAQKSNGMFFKEGEEIPFTESFTNHENTRELSYLPLQSAEYTWDASNWYHNADHHYSYDPVTCLLLTDTTVFSGVNEFINVYAYDSILAFLPPDEAFPSQVTSYIWNGNSWVYFSRYAYTFFPQGYFKAYAFSTYAPVAQQWDTISAWNRIRTFDTDDNPIDMVRQKFNTSSHQYENDYKQVFQYYSPGYLSGYDWYEWTNNQFVLTYRLTNEAYNYYTDPKYYQLNYSLRQDWIANNWVNLFQTFYTYDSNSSQFSNEMVWNGSSWENNSVSSYINDSHENLIEDYDSSWNGVGYDLVYIEKYLLTYGSNGELDQSIYQYGEIYTPLQNYTKFEYSDFTLCNIPTVITEETESAIIYPNPSNGYFTISWHGLHDNCLLQVIDLLGRMVYNSTVTGISSSPPVDLHELRAGNYMLVITSDKKNLIQEIIISGK
jgi:hypothetical protein